VLALSFDTTQIFTAARLNPYWIVSTAVNH